MAAQVPERKRVVIIGGGFGGMRVARELAEDPVDITLIDRNNFHTFQPLLYQVATAGLNAADVAYPIRGIFHGQRNLSFRQATVAGADWDRRHIRLSDGSTVPFDHLVVAAGASTNTFGIDGADTHALPLYGLRDAIHLRNHVLGRFEAADADGSLIDDGALTFVVVGGGATGVEVAGALIELFSQVLRKDFPHLDVHGARVYLLEMRDELLPPFSPASQRHARQILERRGVDVRTGVAVERVTPTRVHLTSGEVIAAHTLVWAAGVRANPLAQALDVETAPNGRVEVGPDLRLTGHPEAFAVGDIAQIQGRKGPLPQVAQVAIQSGRHAAKEIRRARLGRPSKRFHYIDKGTMATIGRRSAVAELPLGIHLQGTLGWFAWLGLHLVYLVGVRNRVSVFLNWAWNYFTWDRGPRLILEHIGDAGVDGSSRSDDALLAG
jgi:NADH dehydrogenase